MSIEGSLGLGPGRYLWPVVIVVVGLLSPLLTSISSIVGGVCGYMSASGVFWILAVAGGGSSLLALVVLFSDLSERSVGAAHVVGPLSLLATVPGWGGSILLSQLFDPWEPSDVPAPVLGVSNVVLLPIAELTIMVAAAFAIGFLASVKMRAAVFLVACAVVVVGIPLVASSLVGSCPG